MEESNSTSLNNDSQNMTSSWIQNNMKTMVNSFKRKNQKTSTMISKCIVVNNDIGLDWVFQGKVVCPTAF